MSEDFQFERERPRWGRIDGTSFGFLLRGLIGFAVYGMLTFAAAAGDVQYARPISNRLNTTGKPIDIDIPLKSGGKDIGDVPVRIEPNDALLLNRSALSEMLAKVLDAASLEKLLAIPADGSFVALTDLRAAGFKIRFDTGLQELHFEPVVEQLAPSDISLSGRQRAPISSTLALPAYASGYVNMYASVDHQWDSGSVTDRGSDTSGRLEMDSAVRLGNFVFENTGVLAGLVDVNVCPTIAICTYTHSPGFKRQLSRLLYDMPEQRIRAEIGDVESLGTSFQRAPNLLGFSLEKSARKLTPGDTLAPTGTGSFVVDRPSRVEIQINGVVRQVLQLNPGTYNIRDLPLATGTNRVSVVITDDAGQTHTVSFTSFFDTNLLAAGKSEWGLTGGVPSYIRDEQRDYLANLYIGSAFVRRGITDGLTAETDFQADKYFAMAGAGALMDVGLGLVNARTAFSAGQSEAGVAFGLDWTVANFQGLSGSDGESFRLSSEYRSPNFHSPGDIDTTDTGVIFPEWNYWLNLDASWSMPISRDTALSLSARYMFVNSAEFGQTFYAWDNDRYGADITLSRPLTETMSGSLTLGVSNETLLATIDPIHEPDPEFRIGVRLYGRPDEHTNISAGYDSLDKQTDISAYRSEGNGIGRWDTSVYVQQNEFDERTSVSATAGYYGNRAQVRIIHNSGFDGIGYSGFDVKPGPQRTSLQVGAALAFADGHFAIGAPVTGDAFAIVYPHESIADKEIVVGANDDVKAIADGWGPALVTSVPAYSPSTISVDADDLPVGYSLGAAAFDTFAPFKAGYALEVGSAYSVSAYGTLLLADNEPVALVSGVAHSIEHPDKSVTIFTNAAGRFGADGLAPGRWAIEMETDSAPTTFMLQIPPGTDGLFKAGTLHPEAVR